MLKHTLNVWWDWGQIQTINWLVKLANFKENKYYSKQLLLLTDILPVYPDSHQFVMEQRTEQYQDLLYAVEMLDLVDMSASRSKILLQMWLLENESRKPPKFPETNYCVSSNINRFYLWHLWIFSFDVIKSYKSMNTGCMHK